MDYSYLFNADQPSQDVNLSISQSDLGTFFTILGWVVAIGTVIGWIISLIKNKKNRILNKQIYEKILRDYDNDITEEEITQKKEAIKRLETEFKSKMKSIEEDIPMLAEVVMLKNSLKIEKETLYNSIKNTKAIIKKLKEYEDESGKDSYDLLRKAETTLTNGYISEKKREHILSVFSRIAVVFAVLSSVMHGFLRDIVGYLYILAFLITMILFYSAKSNRFTLAQRKKKMLRKLLLTSFVLFFLSFIIVIFEYEMGIIFFSLIGITSDDIIIGSLLLALLGLFSIVAFIVLFIIYKARYHFDFRDILNVKKISKLIFKKRTK